MFFKMKEVLHNSENWKWKNYHTVLATFITHLNSISVGMCQGYSSVLLPQLFETAQNHVVGNFDNELIISEEQGSWIASLGVLSNPIGALLSGLLMDTCGRKTTICYTTIPFVFGWIIIGLSEHLLSLCVGRYITGLAIGMASSCYVYVAEISTPTSRGFLSAIGPIFVSLGVLIVYSLGYIMDWKSVAFICACTGIIAFMATLYLPESPAWLASRGSLDEATKALSWFRRDQAAVDSELADILETVKVTRNSKPRSFNEILRYYRKREVWKPFLILITFFIFQELSGIYIVLYYAVAFFSQTGTYYNNYVASIMVASVRFIFSIIGAICIQHFRRKSMATSSSFLMAITVFGAATYEHWYSEVEFNARPFAWIPMVGMLINVSASMLGMLQLPWLMIGELFPLTIRGIMGGLVSSLAYLFIFLTIKFYPTLMYYLKLDGVMWLFSCSSFFAILFAIFYLPETKDKTLFEIERTFKNSVAGDSKENLPNSIITQKIPTVSLSVQCKQV